MSVAHVRYLDALRRGDRHAAYRALDEALDDGRELGQVYLDVVQPAMREIGRLWQEDELTVAEEHLATAITESAMSRMFERVFVWRDVRTPRLLAACAEEERHQMGLRMLCDLLELAGWETTYLGASVPIESLVDLVRKHTPDAVAISATIAPHVPRVREAIQAIRSANLDRQPVIAVGGRVFLGDPSLAERIGADLTAADAEQAVRVLDARLRRDHQAA
ncbi:MAG TPA: cobalamin-dependent protein [Gemmatimonadaceae bacterium]|nr:cobalamin-dependent protein [Gemmatimonadaceae bacterium]